MFEPQFGTKAISKTHMAIIFSNFLREKKIMPPVGNFGQKITFTVQKSAHIRGK